MFRNPYADGLIVLLVVLLIFGPKRLPTLGRSLGQGLREFKDSITGTSESDAQERPEIEPASDAADSGSTVSAPSSERTPAGSGSDRGSADIGSAERRS